MAAVPAARAALQIVSHLAAHGDPVPASLIARALDLPRSSTYQLLRVLMDEGYVVHYPELRAYGLGGHVAEIGSAVLRASRLGSLAMPLLDRVVAESGIPVAAQLAVLNGSDVSYVGQVSAPRAPTTVVRVGVRLPAHLTATGRAMLAALPHAQVRALYPHREALITRQGVGPSTLAQLDAILADARARGVASEDGEITAGYASVAVVALDRGDYPAAAIGATFRSAVADEDARARVAAAASIAAAQLTARLTGRV
jgi:DNA-binding IclR family transcriptional regulator